jgi:CRISPR-associated protein Csm4
MLFQTEEYFPETEIAVYVLYNPELLSAEELKQVFEILGVSGFGAKKSWGKGKFSFRVEEFDLNEGNSEFFISLSTGLPKSDEIKDFYAEFFTKFPKHGRELGRKEIFKNPIILSKPGAVYYPVEKKEVYGSFVNLSVEKEHLHSTFIIPFFPGEKK